MGAALLWLLCGSLRVASRVLESVLATLMKPLRSATGAKNPHELAANLHGDRHYRRFKSRVSFAHYQKRGEMIMTPIPDGAYVIGAFFS